MAITPDAGTLVTGAFAAVHERRVLWVGVIFWVYLGLRDVDWIDQWAPRQLQSSFTSHRRADVIRTEGTTARRSG